MRWSEVIEDATLQNLPYKIELNEWGNIVLSPASNRHGLLQAELSGILRDQKADGKVLTECSVNTHKGVKVADVAWGSKDFFDRNGIATPYDEAPEVCLEIMSPSNSREEMKEKINLYLARGAKEVWLCDENGRLEFYSYRGRIATSRFFSAIADKIEI